MPASMLTSALTDTFTASRDCGTHKKHTHGGTCRPRFTIHGLWKNFDSGRWPQFCHHERFDAASLALLRPRLDAVWPSYYGPNEQFWVRSASPCPLAASSELQDAWGRLHRGGDRALAGQSLVPRSQRDGILAQLARPAGCSLYWPVTCGGPCRMMLGHRPSSTARCADRSYAVTCIPEHELLIPEALGAGARVGEARHLRRGAVPARG